MVSHVHGLADDGFGDDQGAYGKQWRNRSRFTSCMHSWIHDQRTESLVRVSLRADEHLKTRRSSIHSVMIFGDVDSCKEECLLREVKIVQCSLHLDLERVPATLCVVSSLFTSTNRYFHQPLLSPIFTFTNLYFHQPLLSPTFTFIIFHSSPIIFSLSTNLHQSQHD